MVSETSVLPTFMTRPVTMPKLFSAKKAASQVRSKFLRNLSLKSELAVAEVYDSTRSSIGFALLSPSSLASKIALGSCQRAIL